MSSTKQEINKPNPIETPRYTLAEVVRYLHIPIWAALSFRGIDCYYKGWPHPGDLLTQAPEDDVIEHLASETKFPRLSFQEFATLFVCSSLLQLKQFDWHPYPLMDVWNSVNKEEKLRTLPFSAGFLETLLKSVAGVLRLPDEDQALAEKYARIYADRVEVEEGLAVRLYPFSRKPSLEAPRAIQINPRKRFGQPNVVGTGVTTDVLWDRFQAGDSVALLADDYEIEADLVEEAIRYESEKPCVWPWP